jgi:hypothetical protein
MRVSQDLLTAVGAVVKTPPRQCASQAIKFTRRREDGRSELSRELKPIRLRPIRKDWRLNQGFPLLRLAFFRQPRFLAAQSHYGPT